MRSNRRLPRWDPSAAEPEQKNIRQTLLPPKEKTSLLSRAAGLGAARANAITPAQRLAEEEAEILRTINEKKALMSAKEISKDVQYTQSIETGWKPPTHIRALTAAQCDELREQWHIIVEGVDVPPPITPR